MIYKFKCKASGDVIMLGPNGDEMLRLIGREPASKGIIEVAAMAAALQALEGAAASTEDTPPAAKAKVADEPEAAVGLNQRLWPMMDLLRRAQAAGEPIVWGV